MNLGKMLKTLQSFKSLGFRALEQVDSGKHSQSTKSLAKKAANKLKSTSKVSHKCQSEAYKTKSSSTAKKVGDRPTMLSYGSASLVGTAYED